MRVEFMLYERERFVSISEHSFEIELFHIHGVPCIHAIVYGLYGDYSDCTIYVVEDEIEHKYDLQRCNATHEMEEDKRTRYASEIHTFFEYHMEHVFPKWIYHVSRMSTFLQYYPRVQYCIDLVHEAKAWRKNMFAFCTSRCGRRLMGSGAQYTIANIIRDFEIGESMIGIRSLIQVPDDITFGLQHQRRIHQMMRKPFQLGEFVIRPFYHYQVEISIS